MTLRSKKKLSKKTKTVESVKSDTVENSQEKKKKKKRVIDEEDDEKKKTLEGNESSGKKSKKKAKKKSSSFDPDSIDVDQLFEGVEQKLVKTLHNVGGPSTSDDFVQVKRRCKSKKSPSKTEENDAGKWFLLVVKITSPRKTARVNSYSVHRSLNFKMMIYSYLKNQQTNLDVKF